MYKLSLTFIFCMLLFPIYSQTEKPLYSFFTAGHTYGSPNNHHPGLHYPFVNYFPSLNKYKNLELGFLTGDIVPQPTKDYWDFAELDINKLSMPIFKAAGNHDGGNEFLQRFGSYYSSFIHENDLFIILDPSDMSWSIEGAQLDSLKNTLEQNHASVKNIFVFLHELIWWAPDNIFSENINVNYEPHYKNPTNFETVIKPLFLTYKNNICFFAGDLGASKGVSFAMLHKFDNISLIASGMGGGISDNIIITDVYKDYVEHNLIALNSSNPNALGNLSNYEIDSFGQFISATNRVIYESNSQNEIFVYSYFSENYIKITNTSAVNAKINIISANGKTVKKFVVAQKENIRIDTSNFSSGIYIVFTIINGVKYNWKVIVK